MNLKNLQELWLNSNKLKSLEANIFSQMPNLRMLYLNSNQLELVYFADYIYPLKFLNLNNNKLSQLKILKSSRSKIIGYFKYNISINSIWKLETLLIENNGITELPKLPFQNL